VRELELLIESSAPLGEITEKFDSLVGRVNLMKRLHPNKANKYIAKIKDIKEAINAIGIRK
jgi:hypothetical protein